MHEVALSFVYPVGASGRISNPRHWVETHREWNNATRYFRRTFVGLLEIFDVVAGFFGGFDQEHFVVESDA